MRDHATTDEMLREMVAEASKGGERLAAIGTLVPTQKVSSPNVRGEHTENQQWRRGAP